MKITSNVQQLLKDTQPLKVTTHVTLSMSKWSVLRCIIGLKIAALGFRVSGLPVEFKQTREKDSGITEDQG